MSASYRIVSSEEIAQLSKDETKCKHCSHTMIYAKLPGSLFGRYKKHYAIMMQMRFDGTLGFAGGMVDKGETPEEACTRECCEELGVSVDEISITKEDHIVTHYSDHTHFCLHFFAKEIPLELLLKIERGVTQSKDWGEEVFGYVRCPLYTLPNGLGFPAFLRNQFIGNARDQLVITLRRRGLLPEDEIRSALERIIDCVVTKDNTDY